ncbi:MAG: hypothetical protein NTZ33_05135 [Bacteroidetes bacterium]|nr:hypothetical protein [Bacteroidota bacterium]
MTFQIQERLIYNGKKYGMYSEPLNQFFKKYNIDIGMIPKSTACWRGYEGKWEIIDNKLYLTHLEGEGYLLDRLKYNEERLKLRKKLKGGLITTQNYQKSLKILKNDCYQKVNLSLNTFFQNQDKVFAEWYKGSLEISYGHLLKYLHLANGSIIKNILLLVIENGLLVKEMNVTEENIFLSPNK